MSLTTTTYVKEVLGISGSSEDTKLAHMLAAAERQIKVWCGFDFESGTYGTSGVAVTSGVGDSGYYSGNSSRELVLRMRPVTSITSVYLDPLGRFGDNPDGAYASSTLLVAGTDYVLRWDGTLPGSTTRCSHCGILEKIGGVWPGQSIYSRGSINPMTEKNQGNIKVTYVAGYTTIPEDLKYAVALVVAKMRQTAPWGGDALTSESYEDYSYKLASGSGSAQNALLTLGEVRSILSKYRDIPI